jgi:hypothetical protein
MFISFEGGYCALIREQRRELPVSCKKYEGYEIAVGLEPIRPWITRARGLEVKKLL